MHKPQTHMWNITESKYLSISLFFKCRQFDIPFALRQGDDMRSVLLKEALPRRRRHRWEAQASEFKVNSKSH